MANIKSAKKRVKVSEKKAEINKAIKSRVKTYVKKVDAEVKAGNKEEAKKVLVVTESEIMKAATKGVYHKNTASRKVSRLKTAVDKMA